MEKEKVTCPQCGAQATPGRFCEYCGTKMPVVTKKEYTNEKGFNSWYDVLPQGYELEPDRCVKGDYKKSKFLVVSSKDNGKYGIINQQGKFVVDCNRPPIILFMDNYDYIVFEEKVRRLDRQITCSLWNLVDDKKYLNSVKIQNKKDKQSEMFQTNFILTVEFEELHCRPIRYKEESLYDRNKKEYVQLPVQFLTTIEDYNISYLQKNSYYEYKHEYEYNNEKIEIFLYRTIELGKDGYIFLNKEIVIYQKEHSFSPTSVCIYNGKIKYETGCLNIINEKNNSNDEVEKKLMQEIDKIKMSIDEKRKEEKIYKIKDIIRTILWLLGFLLFIGVMAYILFFA